VIPGGEREARLFGACVAASVALHVAALTLGPHLRDARIDPPRVLSVVLAEAPAAPEPPRPDAGPSLPAPKPEPPRPRARPSPKPPPAPVSVVTPEPPAAASEPALPREGAPRTPAPVVAAAPAAAPESLVAPDFRAAYLSNPPPAYPRSARRSGEQGTVTLRVHVDRGGVPTQVEIERSSGSNVLDLAALEAVRNWRFVPARRGTDPVAAWVIVPVAFRLTSGS
jgi:protein TonB